MKHSKFNRDSGVSPVVGVILMVAITVILSAIVASFVLSEAGDEKITPTAGVTFDQFPDNDGDGNGNYRVRVQLTSTPTMDYITVSGGPGDYKNGVDADGDGVKNDLETVGKYITVHDLSEGDKITVTATLNGRSRVIQTYTVSA